MKTDKFSGLLIDNKIRYKIDEELNHITVYTGSCMKQNYLFEHDPKDETVGFKYSICKWSEAFRYGTEAGERFLRNLEFAPHRITGKRKAL